MSDPILLLLSGSQLAHHLLLLLASWLGFWALFLLLKTPGGPGRAYWECPRCALRDPCSTGQGYRL